MIGDTDDAILGGLQPLGLSANLDAALRLLLGGRRCRQKRTRLWSGVSWRHSTARDFDALKEHPGLYQTVQRQPMVRAAFPDLRTKIEQQIAEGDTVATRATMEGTHGGTFFGIAPTNKRLKLTLLLIDQIVDGIIVLHYANADWIGVLVQLGALPPPPGLTKTLT